LFFTNPSFTFHENEILILRVAKLPLRQTLDLFLHGYAYHQHPPFPDLVLQGWMAVTHGQFRWLRLPSIVFFVAGLWFLFLTAREIAGPAAGWATMAIGVFWPYGFHYGRLVGWYAPSFLLTSLLTWAYLRFCRAPSRGRWWMILAAGVALLCTNYFGWAVIACLAIDYCLEHGLPGDARGWRVVTRTPLGTLCLMFLAFLPSLPAFLARLFAGTGPGRSWVKTFAYAAFHVYLLFVGDAAAPWIVWIGIPVGVSVAICLVLVAFRAPWRTRLFFYYFVVLVLAMSLLGILTREREILIAPWLLFPLAVTLATLERRFLRCCLAAALVVIGAIGWIGIASGRFYAMPNLRAPWGTVAESAARSLRAGALVIGDSFHFFFYLTYALRQTPQDPLAKEIDERFIGTFPCEARCSRVYDTVQWLEAGHPTQPVTLLVKGFPNLTPPQDTQVVEKWLDQNCRLLRVSPRLVDPGFALKERYAPESSHRDSYLEGREYDCRSVP